MGELDAQHGGFALLFYDNAIVKQNKLVILQRN